MKKKLVILLTLVLALLGAIPTVAEKTAEEGEDAIINEATTDAFVECFKEFCKEYFSDKAENEAANLDVDNIIEEMADLSPEEAYLEYTKANALLATACAAQGTIISNTFDTFMSTAFVAEMMTADNVYTVISDLDDDDYDATKYAALASCRNAYKGMEYNLAVWDSLAEQKPDVPEEYKALDEITETTRSKIRQLFDFYKSLGEGELPDRISEITQMAYYMIYNKDVQTLIAMYFADAG